MHIVKYHCFTALLILKSKLTTMLLLYYYILYVIRQSLFYNKIYIKQLMLINLTKMWNLNINLELTHRSGVSRGERKGCCLGEVRSMKQNKKTTLWESVFIYIHCSQDSLPCRPVQPWQMLHHQQQLRHKSQAFLRLTDATYEFM